MRVRRPNIRLRGTRFWFRRRVPGQLTDRIGRGEIVRSLRTSCPREAARRARAMWLASDRVFSLVAAKKSLGREQVELILARLLEESVWDSSTVNELVEGFRDGDVSTTDRMFGKAGTEAILALPGGERDDVLHHLERMLDRIAVDTHSDETDLARLEVKIAKLRQATAEAKSKKTRRALDAAVVTMAVQKSLAGRHARSKPEEVESSPLEDPVIQTDDLRHEQRAPQKDQSRKAAHKPEVDRRTEVVPCFSAPWHAFLDEKRRSHDGHKGYSSTTVSQSEMTCSLFLDLVGDKPLDQYTGTDALNFRNLLLRLPQSHGKSKTVGMGDHRISSLDLIRRADAKEAATAARNVGLKDEEKEKVEIPRVKMKTVKRHFSTLRQYYEFLAPLGHVEKNIFAGFKWPGTRSSKKKRDEWSVEALNLLIDSKWFDPSRGREDFMWMTAIGMFSGMRAEEIARLRCIDVQYAGANPFFDIVEQPDGWTPKTEAGVRMVPIHAFLLENGFLQYVQARRDEGSGRIFPAFRGQGPDRKLSGNFSRSFSRIKIDLGISSKIVFHSFRHSVRTILTNAPPTVLRDAWIDAVMGHSADDGGRRGGGSPSVGETTYTKDIHIANLLTAISAIEYPEEVNLGKLSKALTMGLPR